jgi:hypothetical protein
VVNDVLIDSDVFLVIDFINLKIKQAQSFKDIYRSRIYVRVFIGECSYIYINICICTVFLKNLAYNQNNYF